MTPAVAAEHSVLSEFCYGQCIGLHERLSELEAAPRWRAGIQIHTWEGRRLGWCTHYGTLLVIGEHLLLDDHAYRHTERRHRLLLRARPIRIDSIVIDRELDVPDVVLGDGLVEVLPGDVGPWETLLACHLPQLEDDLFAACDARRRAQELEDARATERAREAAEDRERRRRAQLADVLAGL